MTATEIGLNFREEANATRLTIGRASIRFSTARESTASRRKISSLQAAGRISVESLSFRGLDLRPLTNSDRAPNLLGEDLRPDFEQIAMTKLEGRLSPTEDADASSGSAFEVERFAIERAAPNDPARSGLNLSLEHLTAPVGDSGVFSSLAGMGYARLDLSSRLNVIWSEASSELAIDSFFLDGADMGSLNVAAQFANVTPDLASKDEQVARRRRIAC